MTVELINPKTNSKLCAADGYLVDEHGNNFPILRGVPRIAEVDNYTENFGVQWNKFEKTQMDREADGFDLSRKRFFAESGWGNEDLSGKNLLEVGSGAGRFSKVVLEHTQANLYSIDYSDAVTANYHNNSQIAADRFHLFQASIYEMPFPDNSFDKVFCFGVLQHTPDFDASIQALIKKAKPGGEIVVDFYSVNGWWTKVQAKYFLRPITKRMSHDRLSRLIDSNIDWMTKVHFLLHRAGLGVLSRFLPLVDIKGTLPADLTSEQMREWVLLDTFDMFSPQHDHPQRIKDVTAMFEKHGAKVSFAGYQRYEEGMAAAVVRGVKIAS